MVDIQTISIAIASAGVFAAAIYYVLQMRHQAKARQTDLIIRLYSLTSSKDFFESYEKVMEREIKSRKDYKEKYGTFTEFNQVLAIYGALGMLLRRKLIDLDLINDVTVNTVTILYEKVKPLWEPFLKERRIEWDSFQYLYNEMQKREQKGVNSV